MERDGGTEGSRVKRVCRVRQKDKGKRGRREDEQGKELENRERI